jgi:hypothetical protein
MALRPGHIGTGPADAGERTRKKARPEAVGERGKAEVGKGRKARTDQTDPPGGHAVGKRSSTGTAGT